MENQNPQEESAKETRRFKPTDGIVQAFAWLVYAFVGFLVFYLLCTFVVFFLAYLSIFHNG